MRTVSHLEENYISPSAPRLNAFNKTFYSEFIKQVSGKDRSKPKKKKRKKKKRRKEKRKKETNKTDPSYTHRTRDGM